MRLKNQTIGLVKITGPLTFPITFQFMKITGFMPNILQSFRNSQSL